MKLQVINILREIYIALVNRRQSTDGKIYCLSKAVSHPQIHKVGDHRSAQYMAVKEITLLFASATIQQDISIDYNVLTS